MHAAQVLRVQYINELEPEQYAQIYQTVAPQLLCTSDLKTAFAAVNGIRHDRAPECPPWAVHSPQSQGLHSH